VDYFLNDSEHLEGQQHIPLPSSYYASHEYPLLKELNFRVGGNGGWMPFCLYFSNKLMKFRKGYNRVQLLATFIFAYLWSYCVPIGPGAYIRPEVFMAAALIT
jgi:hypothetical protein